MGILELREAFDVSDAVLLEQESHPTAQGLDDLLLAPHHRVEVQGHVAGDLDAELVGGLHVVQALDAPDERLGGDAAPVEARSAQVLLLDDDHLRAELGGTDRGDVPARSRADHDKVRIEAVVRHSVLFGLRRGHRLNLVDQGLDRRLGHGRRSHQGFQGGSRGSMRPKSPRGAMP